MAEPENHSKAIDLNAFLAVIDGLDMSASNMTYHPYTVVMDRAVAFKKLLEKTAPHLSAGRRRELVEYFVAATDPKTPMLFKNRPAGEDLVTFMRREYRDRGLIPTLSARAVEQRDPQLARRYEYALSRGEIPDDIRLPKQQNRPNRLERAQGRSVHVVRPKVTGGSDS